MSKRESSEVQNAPDPEKGIALLAEIFEAIGFEIPDEESYNALAEHAEKTGQRSCAYRGSATIHGRCWKIGHGLEVWSVLYETASDLYCADCRPAFRSRYVHKIHPWEMAEYCEDGEALVRGALGGKTQVLFELQNLTEVKPHMLRNPHLRVGLAGLAFSVKIDGDTEAQAFPGYLKAGFQPESGLRANLSQRRSQRVSNDRVSKDRVSKDRVSTASTQDACSVGEGQFTPVSLVAEHPDQACENDYLVHGRILAWREIENPITSARLVWFYVDTGAIRVELLASRRSVQGRPRLGAEIGATAWLQGHFLEEAEISARYEGIDPDFVKSDSWTLLRKCN
ncbi:MAG TPA: hypothetical protein VI756_20410 [Blastocatellia bacterium]